MRFSAAALLALVSAVFAQTEGFDVISKPGEGEKVAAGTTYEIVWAPDAKFADKPVDIILIGGPTQPKQQVIETIAKDIPSSAGSYKWKVDDTLGKEKVYGIKIQLLDDTEVFQYSFPFAITPAEGDHSSSAPASSAASSTASSTKTKTHTSKPSDYPTASPSSESSTFSSVYVSSSGVPSSITSAASSKPTGTATTATSKTATSTTVATGAATAFGANGFAVLGGLAMAALAL